MSLPVSKAYQRKRVFDHVLAQGERGATCDETELALSLSHQTTSARVNDLMKAERLIDSGLKRRTRYGRPAIVWVALPAT